MSRGGPFGASTAWLGIVTGALGIPLEAFRPLVAPWSMVYGLALPVWFAMVGWALLRISHASRPSG